MTTMNLQSGQNTTHASPSSLRPDVLAAEENVADVNFYHSDT